VFVPIGSNITDGLFFIPGTAGATPAGVRGFGAVFAVRRIVIGAQRVRAGGDAYARDQLVDVVAMDDFIYAEPVLLSVPAAGGAALFAVGAAWLLGRRRVARLEQNAAEILALG
jgi:hypothetical protein